jgi:predicted nucleotidyltransferase
MSFRSLLVNCALLLYWPPFIWLFRFYYWLAIHCSRLLVSRVEGVRSIYLTGSWARQDVIYGLSDIDFKVLVASEKNQQAYQSIRRRFSILRRIFPMLGPPDEKGIYFLDSFDADYRHYPLVQYLFDARFFSHQLLWGEDLIPTLSIRDWKELAQEECVFARLRDWIERIHLLADYGGLTVQQKQHLFFKAVSDIALLATLTEFPESGFPRRAEILHRILPEIESPHRHLIENLILENQSIYLIKLNSEDENFMLFKRMVSFCSEKVSRKDSTAPCPLSVEQGALYCGNGNQTIIDDLRSFSSKIQNVSTIRWPQLPINPFDLHLFNTSAYVLRCSEPIPLSEFRQLKSYCRKNLKNKAKVLLWEHPFFISTVDADLVEHWGSFSGSSDLTHFLLRDAPVKTLSQLERNRIETRMRSFHEQLAAALAHSEFGRMDLNVFPVFIFNALRVMIFNHEFSLGKWQWLLTPAETADYLIKHTPLVPYFPRKLAMQFEKAINNGGFFDERLLPKSRALLAEMLEISTNGQTWKSLETLNSMPDERHLSMSVAIITSNRPAQLERCLRSISQLVAPPEELVIVDNAPNSSAQQVVENFHAACPIRYLCCDQPGVAPARNMAARAARGEIIVFVDDDASVAPDWLERLERVFLRDSKIGLAAGASLNMKCGREDRIWKFMEAVEKI